MVNNGPMDNHGKIANNNRDLMEWYGDLLGCFMKFDGVCFGIEQPDMGTLMVNILW